MYDKATLEQWQADLMVQRDQIRDSLAQVNGAIQLLAQMIEKIDADAKEPEPAETNPA